MTLPSTQLVLGLPGAGKTTFIAALRHVAEVGDVPGALRLLSLGDHDEFVNSIKRQWLQCLPLGRTNPGKEQNVRLRLAKPDGDGAAVDLEFPDLAGELIEQQWTLRRCTDSYAQRARAAAGVLLFIHPDKVVAPTRIADANVALAGLQATTSAQDEPQTPVRAYHPQAAATQVKLVELLQVLVTLRDDSKRFPLAVIVSAWDRVQKSAVRTNTDAPAPSDWLRRFLPLFQQFLTTNSHAFEPRIFGLSAQGGDLDEDKTALQNTVPSQRIQLVDGSTVTSDLTQPVQWLARQTGLLT